MSWLLLIFIAVAVIWAVAVLIVGYRAMRIVRGRSCAGLEWRRRFPDARADEIRRFLDVFVDAFIFPEKHRSRLQPDDRVMDIYHMRNPPGWGLGDSMELETLGLDLERQYGFDVLDSWHDDITLGELFRRVRGITTASTGAADPAC